MYGPCVVQYDQVGSQAVLGKGGSAATLTEALPALLLQGAVLRGRATSGLAGIFYAGILVCVRVLELS